jgi:hypothetical protein
MDGNDKNISPVDPLPPSYLSVALMICPGAQANSVHACNAGDVKRLFESCAWLVDRLAGIISDALRLEHTICSRLLRYCPGWGCMSWP